MSSAATPISPARFAEALKDLPLSTLHLKAAELRNSIAHLDYSNEQLRGFADGSDPAAGGAPDPDCADAIRENEAVIARMLERIALLRSEVEGRGQSWTEFRSAEEVVAGAEGEEGGRPLVNGAAGSEAEEEEEAAGARGGGGGPGSSPWTDGTFQTGRIVNGEVRMDDAPVPGDVNASGSASTNGLTGVRASNSGGGSLDDEALRRAMEERMRNLGQDDDEDGMHL